VKTEEIVFFLDNIICILASLAIYKVSCLRWLLTNHDMVCFYCTRPIIRHFIVICQNKECLWI